MRESKRVTEQKCRKTPQISSLAQDLLKEHTNPVYKKNQSP